MTAADRSTNFPNKRQSMRVLIIKGIFCKFAPLGPLGATIPNFKGALLPRSSRGYLNMTPNTHHNLYHDENYNTKRTEVSRPTDEIR